MANNYYDATGVLMLDRVTPVIRASLRLRLAERLLESSTSYRSA
ncbi:hypothetical protein [Rhodanobacter lindaniclasticus]